MKSDIRARFEYLEGTAKSPLYQYKIVWTFWNDLEDPELIEYKNEQYKKLEARLKIKNTIKQKLSVFKNMKPAIYGCFCGIILLIFLVIYTE